MGLTPQQDLISKYEYWEVFDRNKQIRYGITSTQDMEIIKMTYPNKYIFEKIDLYEMYVNLEKLENKSRLDFKFSNGLTFDQKITIVLVLIIIVCIILCVIFPERVSSLQIKVI